MTRRGESIVLIGFMGVGKSTAGKTLAQKTSLPYFDTDEIIAERFGMSVPEIFASFGEEKFRDAETETIKQFSPESPAIIVTGGGIILRPENIPLLRALGTVVSLEAAEETHWQRVSQGPVRPLLQTENPRASLTELLWKRQQLYHAAADVRLDTSLLTNEEVADRILQLVKKQ